MLWVRSLIIIGILCSKQCTFQFKSIVPLVFFLLFTCIFDGNNDIVTTQTLRSDLNETHSPKKKLRFVKYFMHEKREKVLQSNWTTSIVNKREQKQLHRHKQTDVGRFFPPSFRLDSVGEHQTHPFATRQNALNGK